jgi:signal transduction histidine kinase/ligand-binding sensor domain-containing protein
MALSNKANYIALISLWIGFLQLITVRAQGQAWIKNPLLSTLLIRQIAQDKAGFLWIAADEGVYRYDGYELTPLAALLTKPGPQINAGSSTQVVIDDKQQLWIGSEQGLYRFSLPTGNLTKIELPLDGLDQPSVHALALDCTRKFLWVGYGTTSLVQLSCSQPIGITNTLRTDGELYWLQAAADGTMWAVTTTHHIYHWQQQKWQQPIKRPSTFAVPLPNTSPQLYATTEGLYEATPDGQLREQQRWLPRVAGGHTKFVPYPTKLGWQWIGGGWKITLPRATHALQAPVHLSEAPVGSEDDNLTVGVLWQGRSGSLWSFNKENRGCYQQPGGNLIQSLSAADSQPYSARGITRLPDGRLLVGTYNGPLVQAADSPQAPLRPLRVRVGPHHRTPEFPPLFYAVLTTRQKQVVYAEENGTFGLLTMPTNRLTPLRPDPNTHCINPQALFEDHLGRLWGGANNGLFRLDLTAGRLWRYQAQQLSFPLHHTAIHAITEDVTGCLWLATNTGLYKLEPNTAAWQRFGTDLTGRYHLPTNDLLTAYAFKSQIWVGTKDQGLLQVDPVLGFQRQLSLSNGLPHKAVATILADSTGRLWLGTYAGLVSYKPGSTTGDLRVYTKINGLTNPELNRQSAYYSQHEQIYVGGIGGLYRASTSLTLKRPAPQLLVSSITWGQRSGITQVLAIKQGLLPPLIRFGTQYNSLTLGLALTDYLSPESSRYYYRFLTKENSQDWHLTQVGHRLFFPKLSPGKYTIEIIAETAVGLRAANKLHLSVLVERPWWQQPLFVCPLIIVSVGLMYSGRRWYMSRQEHLQQHQQTLLRDRIAADLHDELGSLLTRIHVQVESASQVVATAESNPVILSQFNLPRLLQNTRAVSAALRDVVWTMDSHSNSLPAMLDRIHDQLNQIEATSNLYTRLEIAGVEAIKLLPPEFRKQFYLVFKEAVTNVLRHADGATQLQVRVAYEGKKLVLEVTDNGTAKLVGRSGTGLRNMRKRAASINAELEAGPQLEGPGFRVHLAAPLT